MKDRLGKEHIEVEALLGLIQRFTVETPFGGS
jgi:hypothetical protein